MKKIGITSTGTLIVEMTTDEYRKIVLLPPEVSERVDPPAIDAVREASARGEINERNFRKLSSLCREGTTVSEMLQEIESSAPRYRLSASPGASPQSVKKLRDVLERAKIA